MYSLVTYYFEQIYQKAFKNLTTKNQKSLIHLKIKGISEKIYKFKLNHKKKPKT